jgi:PAS domain-containing protein
MSHSDTSDKQTWAFGGKRVSVSKLWRLATALADSAEMGALFQSLLEAVPDALVIVDGEGRIALVNAQTEAM